MQIDALTSSVHPVAGSAEVRRGTDLFERKAASRAAGPDDQPGFDIVARGQGNSSRLLHTPKRGDRLPDQARGLCQWRRMNCRGSRPPRNVLAMRDYTQRTSAGEVSPESIFPSNLRIVPPAPISGTIMRIFKDTVVTLNYSLFDPDGELIEKSSEPITYLHGGYDNIFPKVEEALGDKEEGDKVSVVMEPDEAWRVRRGTGRVEDTVSSRRRSRWATSSKAWPKAATTTKR
jgi:hypothetical protein